MQPDRLEDPVKDWGDVLSFVIGRYHHGDPRGLSGHTRTPRPSTFQMSATGLLVTMSPHSRGGGAMISRSGLVTTSSCGTRFSSTATYGSAQSTASALNSSTRLSLYDRLDLMSSETPLKAMPGMPTVTRARSYFCSSRCTRYSGRPSLIVIA